MNSEISQTILEQLGGNRFLAMTGAVCLSDERSLTVRLPKISKLSIVVITLDVTTDTYRFECPVTYAELSR